MTKKHDITFFENRLLDFVTTKAPMLKILYCCFFTNKTANQN